MEHPAINHLESTPDVMRHLLTGISEAQTNWKPSPDRWCLAEVLEHLSHVEAHVFRSRLDLILAQNDPQLEPYDEKDWSAQGAYSGREAEESFAHWEEQREDNVQFLKSLQPEALLRAGIHQELGRMTLEEILNAWAFHDLGHIRQVAELVRAQLYYPRLGVLQKEKQVNP